MIDKAEMQVNAVELIESLNAQNIPGLGAIIIFFDVTHGQPVLAGNVPKAKMRMILKEIIKALPSLDIRESLS